MLKRILCAFGAFLILTVSALAVTSNFEDVALTDELAYSNQMAAVKSGGLWGFVDSRDNLVIDCRYTDIVRFSEGLAFVKDELGWRCINKTGAMLFPLNCDEVWPFSDGIARFKRGGLYGFVDKDGQIITDARWLDAHDAHNGFIAVCEETKWGFIDYTGEYFISADYDEVGDFTQNAAYVVTEGIGQLISVEGEVIYEGVVSNISEGLAKFSRTDDAGVTKYGFVNESGSVIIQPGWEEAGTPSGGKIAVRRDGKWGYIDYQGTMISDCIWDFAAPFSGGFARVALLPEGETLPTSYVYSGYVPDYNYTYIGESGQVIAEDLIFKSARDFHDGRAAVCVDDLWGFIDATGTQIIPCAFKSVSDFASNGALVVSESAEGEVTRQLIDDTGAVKVFYASDEEKPAATDAAPQTAAQQTYVRGTQAEPEKKRGVVSYIAMIFAAVLLLYSVLCAVIRLQAQKRARRKAMRRRRAARQAPDAVISSRRRY